MSARIGRPPIGNPRDRIIPVRLNAAEYQAIRDAATAAGVAMSDYFRSAGLTRARRRAKVTPSGEQAPGAHAQGGAAE